MDKLTPKENDEKKSFFLAIIGVASIPLVIYFIRVYGEIISKSSVYIKNHYDSINGFLLLSLIPFLLFLPFLFGLAKAEGYLGRSIFKNLKSENKFHRFYFSSIAVVLIAVLIYNIFCIYIYVKHIGDNPFLTWEQFINFRQ